MFKPLSICLAIKKNKVSFFSRLVSFSSQVGIMLGAAAIIIVMSVMNGFKQEMLGRFLQSTPHIELSSINANKAPLNLPGLDNFYFYPVEAAIMSDGHFLPIRIAAVKTGIRNNEIIVPANIANNIDIKNRSSVQLVSANTSSFFSLPKLKKLTVNTKEMPLWRGSFAYISYRLALDMNILSPEILPNIYLTLKEPMQARIVAEQLSEKLPSWHIMSWDLIHGDFFRLIATQKTMMFLVLFLIIVIASFGLISGQVMLIQERRSEVAILLTLGCSSNLLFFIYYVRGMLLGLTGLLLGLVIGYFTASHLSPIVNLIEYISGEPWLSHALYGMDHLPSKILWSDIVKLGISGSVLSALTPIYPALMVSRSEPIALLKRGS